MSFLVLLAHCADEVHQSFALETSIFYLFFRLNLNVVALILEDLSSHDIPGPEEVASLRPELVSFLGDQLPKAFVTDTLLIGVLEFLEVVSLISQGGSDESFVLGVLEVDNIMRFYLILLLRILEPAMKDKLP